MQALEVSPLVVVVDLAVLYDITGRYPRGYLPPESMLGGVRGDFQVMEGGRGLDGSDGSPFVPSRQQPLPPLPVSRIAYPNENR